MANHFLIDLHLPQINGQYEAGVAVGTDPGLPEDEKLPIRTSGSMDGALTLATVWAYRRFNHVDPALRERYVAGAAIAISAGLCRKIGNLYDGDWRETREDLADPVTDAEKAAIRGICSTQNLMAALTIVVATKVNYWRTNHHTRQGETQGYAKKVLVQQFNRITDETVRMAHTLGHWCSTLFILDKAGIQGLQVCEDAPMDATIEFRLGPNAKLRFESMPAGTDRLAVVYEGAKRLVRSVLAPICPGIEDLVALREPRARVMEHPAAYHVGAKYLTGEDRRAYADTDFDSYIGRVGIFIKLLYPRSTLALSPHFALLRIESAKDYDTEWMNSINSYKTEAARSVSAALRELTERTGSMSKRRIDKIRRRFDGHDSDDDDDSSGDDGGDDGGKGSSTRAKRKTRQTPPREVKKRKEEATPAKEKEKKKR